MKIIKSTNNFDILIDNEDYEFLNQYNWYTSEYKYTRYASLRVRNNPNIIIIILHRLLLKALSGEQIDHKDGNGLNNQKNNLRLCTNKQNSWNSRLKPNNTTGYKGVKFDKRRDKWLARIVCNGKEIFLGYFNSPIDAALARDKAAIRYHGEFAWLNFPLKEN